MTKMRDLFIALLVGAGLLMACVLSMGLPSAPRIAGDGLFSWHEDVFSDEGTDELLKTMRKRELREVYQSIPESIDASVAHAFIAKLAQRSIRTFLLAGDPSWGEDPSGAKAVAAVERAASLKGCAGVVLDVETYHSDAWKANPEASFVTFISALANARTRAHELGLELIVCIPYSLDKFDTQLERLITDGCDALAVMNYRRSDELAQLSFEAELCAKHNRRLINVYELQAPGTADLTDANTYYTAGLTPLSLSMGALREGLASTMPSADSLCFAFHDYDALRELIYD